MTPLLSLPEIEEEILNKRLPVWVSGYFLTRGEGTFRHTLWNWGARTARGFCQAASHSLHSLSWKAVLHYPMRTTPRMNLNSHPTSALGSIRSHKTRHRSRPPQARKIMCKMIGQLGIHLNKSSHHIYKNPSSFGVTCSDQNLNGKQFKA